MAAAVATVFLSTHFAVPFRRLTMVLMSLLVQKCLGVVLVVIGGGGAAVVAVVRRPMRG